MTKRSTKSALLSAILALVICFTALVGTTFAWFTDSVTSANNKIVAGNLDVELYYQVEGQADWTKVTDMTNIFKENALWEPGHTEVVKLKVVNEGSLALKYQLGVNVAEETGSTNMAGKEFKLSDYIKFAVIDGANTYTRDEAVAAAEANNATALKTVYNSATTALEAKNEKIVTMVVYMPTSVGNEANAAKGAATPTIHLGINLFATQLTSEEDSFGPDYDADATIESTPVAVPAEGGVTVSAADVVVEIPAEAIPAGVTSITLTYSAPKVDAANGTVSFASIELVDQNGNEITPEAPVAVALPAQTAIEAGKDVVALHDGAAVASTVVKADGSIAYTTAHFCEVTIVEVTKVATADELKAAVAKGGNYQLTADITISAPLSIVADTAIYGFGKTITYTGSNRAIDIPNNANAKINVTLDNLTVDCTASYCERGVNYNDNGALTLNKVTVRGTNVTYALNLPGSSDDAIVVINDCALTGNIALNVWGANATITANNTVFTSVDKIAEENYAAISVNNDGSTNAANGTVIYINGGKIIALDEKGEFSSAVRNATATGKVEISDSTEVIGNSNRPVAIVDYGTSQFYSTTTLQAAIDKAIETKGNVKLTANIVLGKPIVVDGTVAIDLNGYTISGTCTASQGYLFMVNNGAKLTVLDSSEAQTGKITFAQGTSNVGWAIDLEGELVLESGTIELTGDSWSIGYCVDVRPNAWGTAYTNPTVFTMNGGKLVSSDGAIRVASSSSETYTGVSAKFVMNGGEIEAAWDGIFVQQSNAAYDILTVELNGGKVASALSPVRVYGPVATSVVGGAEKPMTLKIGANAELSVIGEIDTSRTWYKDGVVVLGGGMTVEALEQYTTITIAE